MNYNKQKTVIVYLAMNTKKDATYGRDSRSMLEKSLDSLYKCYNNQFKHDIIIFYDNKAPFLDKDQIEIKKGRNEISFKLLSGELWAPPYCDEIKRHPDPKTWVAPHFSLGYRNMMRWYGILIYKYLTDMGYEWYMRMDDDSLLHSEINYDLFKFMYNNNYEYGFRSYCNDGLGVSDGLIEFCDEHIKRNNITPTFLERYIKNKTSWKSSDYNIVGYYNNFLISKLSFWMRSDVQKFLKEFDNSGYMYTRRWNDLISQAVTIQIFMDRSKVYHFNDWSYEHCTFSGNYNSKVELDWGGLYPKIENGEIYDDEYTNQWFNKYNNYHINTFDTLDIKDCVNVINQDILIDNIVLSNDYNLNNQKKLTLLKNKLLIKAKYEKNYTTKMSSSKNETSSDSYYLGKFDTLDSVHNAINDHWINCETPIQRLTQFQYETPVAFIWYNNSQGDLYNKLYAINNRALLNTNTDTNTTNTNATSFLVEKSIFVISNLKKKNLNLK
jgi:hypothetical protein